MTLPEWLDSLYSPDEMRAADRFSIGALLTKGLEPFPAAGVFAFIDAIERDSERIGGADYTIASDIVDTLPEALSTLR